MRKRSPRRCSTRHHVGVERLEDRWLLSASPSQSPSGSPLDVLPAVATAPTVTGPSAIQTVAVGQTLAFSTANDNAIQIQDPGATGTDSVTIQTAVAGTLSYTANSGYSTVSGAGTDELTFTGTVAGLNSALNTLVYTPTPTDIADALTVTATDGALTSTPFYVFIEIPPPVVTWTGAGGDNLWSDANNWSTGAVPSIVDAVSISISGNPTFVFSAADGNVTVSGLEISDPLSITGGSIIVEGNSTLSDGLSISSGSFTSEVGDGTVTGGFSMTGGSLTATGPGGSLTISGTTSITGGSLFALNGSTLSLASLTAYTGGIGNTITFEASGAGSVLSLPNLASIAEDTTSIFSNTKIDALAGGQVSLPALASITGGPVQLESDGSGSTLGISSLTTFDQTYEFAAALSGIQATNSGTVSDGKLTTLAGVGLTLDGTGTIAVSQYTSIQHGFITLTDGASFVSPDFSSLTNINDTNVVVSGGATLTLAGVTSYAGTFTGIGSGSFNSATLEATGAGSSLSLANLTTFTEDTTSVFSETKVEALAGGQMSLPALKSITGGAVQVTSDGAGSSLNVAALTTFTGFYALGEGASVLQVTNGATALDGELTSMTLAGLTLDGTGTVAVGQYTSIDRGVITITDGASFVSPNFSSLTSIGDSSVLVSGGATLSLVGVTSYAGTYAGIGSGNFNSATLEATGAGSSLSLANLTTFTEDTTSIFSETKVEALAGGQVSLPALTSITGGAVQLTSDGAGSSLNVSSLTTFTGFYALGEGASVLQVTNGATALDGELTSMTLAGLTLDGTGTVAVGQYTSIDRGVITINAPTNGASFVSPDFSGLTSIDDSSVLVSGGATLSLVGITSYAGTYAGIGSGSFNSTTLQATGTGSSLSLPNLAEFTEDATQIFSNAHVQALAGGQLSLPGLTAIVGGDVLLEADGAGSVLDVSSLVSFSQTYAFAATDSRVQATNSGTVLDSSLTTLVDAGITLDGTGTMSTSQLTSIIGATIMLSGGASVSMPLVTTFGGSLYQTTTLQASGAGTILSVPNLATIVEDTTNFFSVIDLQAVAGGELNLPGLTTIGGGPVQLKSDGAGSLLNVSSLASFTQTAAGQANHSSVQVTNDGSLVVGDAFYLGAVSLDFDATGSVTVAAGQTLTVASGTLTDPDGSLVIEGSLAEPNTATVVVSGSVALNGSGVLDISATSTLEVSGNLLGATQNASQFSALGTVVLNGAGTAGAPQLLEAMSYNVGASSAGFQSNFNYGTLRLSGSTYVKLVDQSQNSPVAPAVSPDVAAAPEAVYANELVVPAGATLNLDGLNLYVYNSQVAGTIVNGTVTVLGAAHTPTVTNASTPENTQSTSGLVIAPNADDVGVVTNFQITNITGGTLFLNDGVTPVADGDFITVAQGAAGLKFTPTTGSSVAGAFTVQSSTSGTAAGLSGPTAAASITVTTLPSSSVTALPARTSLTSITVSWTGTPGSAGIAIASYDIYEKVDSGAYTLWQSNTTAKSATLAVSVGHTYAFYSQATDADGDVEPTHVSADTQVAIMAKPWHNTTNNLDVIGSGGEVIARDALLVIQYLNNPGPGPLPASAPVGSYFLDVEGNNIMEALDALVIIQALNAQSKQTVAGAAIASNAVAPSVADGGNSTPTPSVAAGASSGAVSSAITSSAAAIASSIVASPAVASPVAISAALLVPASSGATSPGSSPSSSAPSSGSSASSAASVGAASASASIAPKTSVVSAPASSTGLAAAGRSSSAKLAAVDSLLGDSAFDWSDS